MSVQAQLISARDNTSARCLINKDKQAKPPKLRHFNPDRFERHPEDPLKAKALTLKHVELPYEHKRKKAKKLQIRSFRWALSNAISTIVVIACALVDSEMNWYGKVSSLQSSALRAIIIAVSILQIAISVKYAKCKLKRRKIKGLQHLKSTLHTASLLYDSPHLLQLLGEITHLCILMPPWVDFSFEITHNQHYHMSLSNFVTIAIILRVYYIINFLYSQSPYHSQRAQFFTYPPHSKLHGTYDDFWFIVVSQMKQHPFLTLSVLGAVVAGLAGFLMHTLERSVYDDLLIYDGPWYVAVTQLTVGYGDIVAKTDIGRVLAIGGGLLGVSTLALVVTFAFRQLSLTSKEKAMIETLYTHRYMQSSFKLLACLFIQRKWRLQRARRSHDKSRLRLIFLMQEIHYQFKKKFGKALKATPELEDQIRIFNLNVFKVLTEGRRRLQTLRLFTSRADQLSTRQVNITSRLLSFKRAYLRMIFSQKFEQRRHNRVIRHQSQRRRNSILSKKESDLAVRKLIERMQGRAETVKQLSDFDSRRRRSLKLEEDAASSRLSSI